MKTISQIQLSILLLTLCVIPTGAAKLTLGSEGEILVWLISKPFPNPTDKDFANCKGFDTDYLGYEAKSAPNLYGKPTTGSQPASWELALADPMTGIDFATRYRPKGSAVVYAFTSLVSPSETDALLLIGSDDGIKVWLNGNLVHNKHQTRGLKRDEDEIPITLKQGENRLLCKVDQHYGGWGLIARVTSRDHTKIDGLLTVLDVRLMHGSTQESALRKIIGACDGKPGVLDTASLSRYLQISSKLEFWKPWLDKKSLQNVPNWLDRLLNAKTVDATSSLLNKAALDLTERFDTMWSSLCERIQNPKPLISTDVAAEDYIRVAEEGRYFVHADGRFFTPIGYNHNPDWTPLHYCAPGISDYDPKATEQFFRHLRDSGVNLIRMMVEFPAGGHFMENPIGTYRPEHVLWLDAIFRYARKYDIRLMITPYDTFWMNHRWEENPFNAKNGGPVQKKSDFLTKPEVIEAQKRRWRYIIDRWGNLGTVFAWELLNEADYWWEASPQEVIKWANEMSNYVREYEKARWGRNHLITISTGRPMPADAWGTLAYRLQGIDFATTHLYIGASNAPDEPIGPALAERQGVTYALSQITDNRPYIDGENGPINRWIADENLDNEVFHNMSWAHLASGGAGSGLRWPYRGPHHLTEGMFRHLYRMSKFVQAVPWEKMTGAPAEIRASDPEGGVTCATATDRCAIVWIATPSESLDKVTASWTASPPSIHYRCYDTKTGKWFLSGQLSPKDGTITLSLPRGHTSVAIIME